MGSLCRNKMYNASDNSWILPLGFAAGATASLLLWRSCLPAIDKRYTLEQQMQLGMRGLILAFFFVAPLSLLLMTTRNGVFFGIFLFALSEVFFMIVIQSARLRSRK